MTKMHEFMLVFIDADVISGPLWMQSCTSILMYTLPRALTGQ